MNSLDMYFSEMVKYPRTKSSEESKLAREIQRGNKKALKKLIEANLRLVIKIAKKYQNGSLPLCDIIGEGNIGLIKAAEKFRHEKGIRFSTYARYWIEYEIRMAIKENRIVHIPANQYQKLSKLKRTYHDLSNSLNREPTLFELEEETKLETKEITTLFPYLKKEIPLDEVINSDNPDEVRTLYKFIPYIDIRTNDGEKRKSENYDTKKLFTGLDEQEKEVIELYYGFSDSEHTLEEIGEILKLTRERIRQIKNKAETKIKNFLVENQVLGT